MSTSEKKVITICGHCHGEGREVWTDRARKKHSKHCQPCNGTGRHIITTKTTLVAFEPTAET